MTCVIGSRDEIDVYFFGGRYCFFGYFSWVVSCRVRFRLYLIQFIQLWWFSSNLSRWLLKFLLVSCVILIISIILIFRVVIRKAKCCFGYPASGWYQNDNDKTYFISKHWSWLEVIVDAYDWCYFKTQKMIRCIIIKTAFVKNTIWPSKCVNRHKFKPMTCEKLVWSENAIRLFLFAVDFSNNNGRILGYVNSFYCPEKNRN